MVPAALGTGVSGAPEQGLEQQCGNTQARGDSGLGQGSVEVEKDSLGIVVHVRI